MTTPQAVRRRERWIVRLLVVTILLIFGAIGGQLLINGSLQDQQNDQHANSLNACKQGNKRLRKTINQRIVAPLRASGNEKVRTVPYAVCKNLYPATGDPHRPYYRHAPLPPLLETVRSEGPVASSGTVDSESVGDKTDHPDTQSPQPGSSGTEGTPPPTASSPAPPPPPAPSQDPGLVCGLTGICIGL